jgi:hypothetical protein
MQQQRTQGFGSHFIAVVVSALQAPINTTVFHFRSDPSILIAFNPAVTDGLSQRQSARASHGKYQSRSLLCLSIAAYVHSFGTACLLHHLQEYDEPCQHLLTSLHDIIHLNAALIF